LLSSVSASSNFSVQIFGSNNQPTDRPICYSI
jgi:hypothetical protein